MFLWQSHIYAFRLQHFMSCPASGGEASVLEVWRVWSTHSLLILPSPLWPRVIVNVRVLSIGQINLWKILVFDRNAWNHTTVCKLNDNYLIGIATATKKKVQFKKKKEKITLVYWKYSFDYNQTFTN